MRSHTCHWRLVRTSCSGSSAEGAEKAAVILTTNLPLSEWTHVIPNARLCKALIDRITERAHIVDGHKVLSFSQDNRETEEPKFERPMSIQGGLNQSIQSGPDRIDEINRFRVCRVSPRRL